MKLEFLDDITDGGRYPLADPKKLIRLFSFDHEEAEKLRNVIQFWIVNKGESLEISALGWVKSINCNLTFEISSEDSGIEFSSTNNFVCRLAIERYREMIQIISKFCVQENDLAGYNWLYDPAEENKIDLLFSPGGTW